jgi:hypothetical protein
MKIASIPYNEREGEKKKFRLKPFRSKATIGSSSSPAKPISTPPVANDAGAAPFVSRPNPTAPTTAPTAVPALAKDTVTMTTGLFGNQELLRKSGLFKTVKTETAATQTAAEIKPEEEIIELASRTYSLDEIKNAWSQFTAQHLGHNMQIQTAFKVADLELPANDLLIVGLPSETQKMYFDGERGKLGEFLRNNFDIKGIKFETRILKANEVKSTFKTEKQQFEDLVAQNPAIDIMRQKLGLQIDF